MKTVDVLLILTTFSDVITPKYNKLKTQVKHEHVRPPWKHLHSVILSGHFKTGQYQKTPHVYECSKTYDKNEN